MKAEELKLKTAANLELSRTRLRELNELGALGAETPVLDLIEKFDSIRRPINEIEGWIELMSAVHPDSAVRDEAEKLERDVSAWSTELSQNREAWEVLARFKPEQCADAEAERFLVRTLRDFKRSGVDRDEKTRARLRELSEALVISGQEFDRNIVEDARELIVKDGRAGLAGLPEDFVRAHEEDDQGQVRISTDPQDWIPFISFADRADLREGLMRERYLRAFPRNLEVLKRILQQRHEFATLLGYPNWAAYTLEELMSRDSKIVGDFIGRCSELARDRSERELAEQIETMRELTGDQDAKVNEWDRHYLAEKIKRSKYHFDAQDARAYFPYAKVLRGVLDVASGLYGVEFVERDDLELWHPSVQCFDIQESGNTIARFYLDMHPRQGKYKHAAMFPLVSGFQNGPLPEAALVCNFPAPSPGEPGLLLHDQVTTVFHEFGHLFHHLFSKAQRYLRFAGLATEWDFVEVPSQLFEEWAWNPAVLQSFAHHHETGEPIPEDLVRRMRAADEYGRGIDVRAQMSYAAISLGLHSEDPAGFDPAEKMIQLRAPFAPFPHIEGTCFLASFGHLNGYSATYYTYMWSLVIAKDLFSRFEPEMMSSKVAAEYRARVIGCGGERDAADLVQSFLGRQYSTAAWERSLSG